MGPRLFSAAVTMAAPSHFSCKHRGCREGLALRSGARVQRSYCTDKNPWLTNAERATFESLLARPGRQRAVSKWTMTIGTRTGERKLGGSPWMPYTVPDCVRLIEPGVNCKCGQDGLTCCLLQGRNDHETIWGTQDPRCELLRPRTSLLPLVQEVGLGLGGRSCVFGFIK